MSKLEVMCDVLVYASSVLTWQVVSEKENTVTATATD
jgi:hypothetical protein